jgi:putative endopeptidase
MISDCRLKIYLKAQCLSLYLLPLGRKLIFRFLNSMTSLFFRKAVLFGTIVSFLISCSETNKKSMKAYKDILVENIDTTIHPGDDFFKYACGNWLKKNPIPESESVWNIGKLVEEEIYFRLKEISEKAAEDKSSPQGSALQKIGDFYFSGNDTAKIEKDGITPLRPELERIDGIKDIESLLKVVTIHKTFGVGSLFSLFVAQDDKNSDEMVLILYQGGLGLPAMEYYFDTDDRTAKVREEYVKHVARILKLIGAEPILADKQADKIMKMETSLASKSRKLEDLRDPYKNYNKFKIENLNKKTPLINWKEIIKELGIEKIDSIIVGQPEFLVELDRCLGKYSLEDWKVYLKWHLIASYAEYLSSSFEDEDFYFRSTVLSGTKMKRDRWKRILDAQEDALGEALGQLYIEKYFPESTRHRYNVMVDNVLSAFRERILKLEWLSHETKEKAISKLAKVGKKVGYPDKWKNYSALQINRDSYVLNVMRANQWYFRYEINKLGKPVDRTEWYMTPQTWNAYYSNGNNEIVLPAAIFIIPGIVDWMADDAMMYGYVGASTIGHEIVHGFDDQGRQYNEKGNLASWWTKKDEKQFNARAKVMEEQFNQIQVLDSLHVNGKATLGENMADMAGILIAYDAFQKTSQAKEAASISGLTPDQRFFLGYALSWLGNQREERLARQILTDVHSPYFIRVNGPLSNIPAFYKAFGVKPGDKLYREQDSMVTIW